jgi:Fe2+ transport system protein FeoA
MDSPISLTMAPSGQNLRLINVHGGKRLMHRLAELGLTPGVEMMIVQDSGGPILVSVRNSRIALGRGIAHKLDVATI